MPTTIVNAVEYYYDVDVAPHGDFEQPETLVLLHGFMGSTKSWTAHRPVFATYYRTVVVDLLGHGQTEAPADPARYTIGHSASDLAGLLTTIAPGPLNLLGYSMGGRLALYFAIHYPYLVQRLILESASPGLADGAAQQERIRSDEQLATDIETQGMAAFVARWEALPLFASQQALPTATQSMLHEQRLRNRPHGLANSLRGMGAGAQPSLWEQLSALSVPTLLLAGALDQKFKVIAEQMRTYLPKATVAIIPEAGHTIHLEQPQAFQTQVINFLQS
ncbi:MAG: 2-succinyl-6-hydroxy-2,4-cyclohexadiene-1-carboxylate synthase [Caldilinea sp. CFX5]|nr:2-succinyl-6-hydroxy-2,4-cyclohexadiene-1-carboxylate synthase [Caldilinea sp. CFX5]